MDANVESKAATPAPRQTVQAEAKLLESQARRSSGSAGGARSRDRRARVLQRCLRHRLRTGTLPTTTKGQAASFARDYGGAERLLKKALKIFAEFGQDHLMARAEAALGTLFLQRGDNERALPYFDQAIAAIRSRYRRAPVDGDAQQPGHDALAARAVRRGPGDVCARPQHGAQARHEGVRPGQFETGSPRSISGGDGTSARCPPSPTSGKKRFERDSKPSGFRAPLRRRVPGSAGARSRHGRVDPHASRSSEAESLRALAGDGRAVRLPRSGTLDADLVARSRVPAGRRAAANRARTSASGSPPDRPFLTERKIGTCSATPRVATFLSFRSRIGGSKGDHPLSRLVKGDRNRATAGRKTSSFQGGFGCTGDSSRTSSAASWDLFATRLLALTPIGDLADRRSDSPIGGMSPIGSASHPSADTERKGL